MKHASATQHAARQRGSVLVLVLGVTLIVGVIGLSSLWAVRLAHADVQLRSDAAQAQHYADSAIPLIHTRLSEDSNWRTRYTHDTWSSAEIIGQNSTLRFKLLDDQDADLANNMDDDARLLVRVMHGNAVRLVSHSFSGNIPNPQRGSYQQALDSF